VFLGPTDSNTPKIKFTTAGYTENADVYYAVVSKDDAEDMQGEGKTPDYSAYTYLDTVGVDTWERAVNGSLASEQYIYLIVYKDGEVSEPEIINTAVGGEHVEHIWGGEPYMSFYVKSGGNNNSDNPGTEKNKPLATVGEALNRLAAAYAPDDLWPGKGTDDVHPGAIIILGTVNVAEQITINGDTHPPIVLCDDPQTPGTLNATAAIGTSKNLLQLENGARVTLAGTLTLKGLKSSSADTPATKIRGVSVNSSTFTMNGGKISGYYIDANASMGFGGGVSVDGNSKFTMNNGTISDCNAGRSGGVSVTDSSTFIMNNGTISDCKATINGGVYVAGSSTFTMNNGEISKNFSTSLGGGVTLASSTFIMNGGTISDNSIHSGGGGGVYVSGGSMFTMNGGEISKNKGKEGAGVFVISGGTFTMTKGEIWGNIAAGGNINSPDGWGGGVYINRNPNNLNSSFTKTGGTIYGYDGDPNNSKNNKAVNWSNEIEEEGGHAVYIDIDDDSPLLKNTIVGENDNLYFNVPNTPDFGWD
jgi:hypothetical protein